MSMLIFFACFLSLDKNYEQLIWQLISQLHFVSLFSTCTYCVYSFFLLVFGIVCGYIYGVFILVMYFTHLVALLVCIMCVEYCLVSLSYVILFTYVPSICAYIYLLLRVRFCYFLYFVKCIYGTDLCGFDILSFCFQRVTQSLIYCILYVYSVCTN